MADTDTTPAPPVAVFKKRANKGTSNIRKRPATPPPVDSDSDASYTSSEESGARVKRRRKEGVAVKSDVRREPQDLSKAQVFEADREAKIAVNDDATKTSNWGSSIDAAAEVARATARQQREGKGDSDATATSRAVGPQKSSSNVRTITVTDFAPDVCKDYKQTGFCGFGDGCKFLHAREDYKQGWQLDKEWEKVGSKAKNAAAAPADDLDDEAKMLEGIPFKCIICKEDYKRPVVTRCSHYFCERCAMTRYMKGKKKGCANCGADTNGTFNVARKLNELLEKKRQRENEKDKTEGDG